MTHSDGKYPTSAQTFTADANDETVIVRRQSPRHAVAAADDEGAVGDEDLADDDSTVIVERSANADANADAGTDTDANEDTRLVPKRARVGRPATVDAAADSATDSGGTEQADDDATVRSMRGSVDADTQLSSRRAVRPVLAPQVDELQRRYEPPQVQSGSSVRYAARPAPIIVAPAQPAVRPEPTLPDPVRIALAEAAAEIRSRAVRDSRRRRMTLIVILAGTLLVLIAAAAVIAITIPTW